MESRSVFRSVVSAATIGQWIYLSFDLQLWVFRLNLVYVYQLKRIYLVESLVLKFDVNLNGGCLHRPVLVNMPQCARICLDASNIRRIPAQYLQCTLQHAYWGCSTPPNSLNTLRRKQNCRQFADISKRIFLNVNAWNPLTISLMFVPKFQTLVQIMAWHRLGDKPLSEPMMVSSLTHICVTQPHWVKVGKVSPVNMPQNVIIRPVSARC